MILSISFLCFLAGFVFGSLFLQVIYYIAHTRAEKSLKS
jgi:hypothetical protein